MNTEIKFSDLNLPENILTTLTQIGYQTPTPIQIQAIPNILEGRDILGMAQTGTGKTAAFALPILANINLKQKDPQVLVLAPTRELAIQVSEAFKDFAKNITGLGVLAIYGGADYSPQIKALKRGVHVVVGTPGRIMDHIKKGTLQLGKVTNMVLDEADEMLQMGFIDDVEWVLKHTPENRQISLFSATMPKEIHRIAKRYLKDPAEVFIKQKTVTATNIEQKYWLVSGLHKLDAFLRILECEAFDAMLVFTRTKTATVDLADKLIAQGYSAAALNGDLAQNQRERIITQLKNKKLDIVVATDVAARGLDVARISHVINYDIPRDNESYVHRIGRTGRAGRSGVAILFVAPKERRMLKSIERTTKKDITPMVLPTTEQINQGRVARFEEKIKQTHEAGYLEIFSKMVQEIAAKGELSALEIAAALAKLQQGNMPFFLSEKPMKVKPIRGEHRNKPQSGMQRFRLEVGKKHGVKPGNIIGCIANEANIDGQMIQNLSIEDNFSFVDLPNDIALGVFSELKKAWVSGQQLNISPLSSRPQSTSRKPFANRRDSYKDKRKDGRKQGKKDNYRSKDSDKKPHRKGKSKATD